MNFWHNGLEDARQRASSNVCWENLFSLFCRWWLCWRGCVDSVTSKVTQIWVIVLVLVFVLLVRQFLPKLPNQDNAADCTLNAALTLVRRKTRPKLSDLKRTKTRTETQIESLYKNYAWSMFLGHLPKVKIYPYRRLTPQKNTLGPKWGCEHLTYVMMIIFLGVQQFEFVRRKFAPNAAKLQNDKAPQEKFTTAGRKPAIMGRRQIQFLALAKTGPSLEQKAFCSWNGISLRHSPFRLVKSAPPRKKYGTVCIRFCATVVLFSLP